MFNCIGMLPFVNFIQAQIMRDRKHYHSVPHYLLFYYGAKLLILFHVCEVNFGSCYIGFYGYYNRKRKILKFIEVHRCCKICCKFVAFKDTRHLIRSAGLFCTDISVTLLCFFIIRQKSLVVTRPLGIDWLLKYSSEHYVFSISCPTLIICGGIPIVTVR